MTNIYFIFAVGPLDSRPDLRSYLSVDDYNKYVSMIGADDWCINFDKASRSLFKTLLHILYSVHLLLFHVIHVECVRYMMKDRSSVVSK